MNAGLSYSYWDNHVNANTSRRIVLEQGPTAKLTADFSLITVDLLASYLESFNYDDETAADPRLNTRTLGSVTITRNGETTVAKLMGQYALNDAPLKKIPQSDMTADASIKKTWSSFSATVGATHISREPYAGVLLVSSRDFDQPEQETKGALALSWDIGFGLSFTGGGSYAQWENYISAPLAVPGGGEATKSVLASATVQTMSLGAVITPVSWISVGASYDFTQRDFAVEDEEMAESFRKKVHDEKVLSKISLALNYQF
jgi:hypothetical protein